MTLKNTKFEKRLQNLDSKIWKLIAEIDEIKGQWSASAKLTPSILTTLRQSTLITSAGASTRIEGSHLSDEQVEHVMRGLSVTKFRERDVEEVRGYLEVLPQVWSGFETISLREGVIRHLHKQLLQYSKKDEPHRGKYKQKENIVGVRNEKGDIESIIFETTKAYLVPKEMTEIVEWTYRALEEKEVHPLLAIGNFLVEFLKIHPFEDGNGRLSRILTNVLLLHACYLYMPYVSHEKIIEQRKEEYYIALRKSQETFGTDHESIRPWLQFFLGVVDAQGKQAMKLLESEHLEDTLSKKQFQVWEYIASSQDASAGGIADHTGIPRPTVNQALEKLLALGKIKRMGVGRATRYRKLA